MCNAIDPKSSMMSNPKTYNIGGGMEWATFDSFDRVARCPKCGFEVKNSHRVQKLTKDIKSRYHSCPSCRAQFMSMETRR